jgi:hypothetical protein
VFTSLNRLFPDDELILLMQSRCWQEEPDLIVGVAICHYLEGGKGMSHRYPPRVNPGRVNPGLYYAAPLGQVLAWGGRDEGRQNQDARPICKGTFTPDVSNRLGARGRGGASAPRRQIHS